jgi:hypothetical protein
VTGGFSRKTQLRGVSYFLSRLARQNKLTILFVAVIGLTFYFFLLSSFFLSSLSFLSLDVSAFVIANKQNVSCDAAVL